MSADSGVGRDPAAVRAAGMTVLLALGAGAFAAVLAVEPYRSFDLDRFFVPKELAMHAAALAAGIAALAAVRRLSLGKSDIALCAWLGLSAISALFAPNHWLAWRSVTLSLSAAAVFWSARTAAAAGFGPALARILALTVVAGAVTALAQAYGVKLDFAALNRAPGGTFGNRNFMAHLTAAGTPLLAWCVASARRRLSALFWTLSLGVCAGALVLSRTRASWLALAATVVLATIVVLRGPALLDGQRARRRMALALGAAAAGVLLALAIPNSLDWRSDSPYLDSVRGVVDFRGGSGRGRVAQYANSLKMTVRHPVLGVGPGNWPVIYPKFAPPNDPSLSDATGMTANPWPSSDWVAALSERGAAAFLALAAFFLLLLGGALKVRYDHERAPAERLAALAAGGVVLIAALEGWFDAVLLLPTPAIVVLGAAGALLPAGQARAWFTMSKRWRILLGIAFAAVTSSAVILSVRRIQAMRLYETGTTAAIELALKKDAGSYRIQMRAADYFAGRALCEKARTHALAASALFPSAPGPRKVLAQCRGSR